MIALSGIEPFASGYNRHCYRHPDDPALCLKVLRPENIEVRYQRQAWPKKMLGKARIDDNRQELRAHQQQAIRALINDGHDELVWAPLPQFHGAVETSLGPANMSELLFDDHGLPGETLEHYLKHRGFDQPIRDAAGRFCNWLLETGILTRNLLPHNLVIADKGGLTRQDRADMCAGFQAAVVDVLAEKTRRALAAYLAESPAQPMLAVAGGVSRHQGASRS